MVSYHIYKTDFPLEVLLRANSILEAFSLMMMSPDSWPLVYNRNTIRGRASVLIGSPNIEEQNKDIPNIIGKGYKEEGPERCEQKIVGRVEEGLGEVLEELKAERSDIDNEDALESGQTNVQRTSWAPKNS